MKAEGCIRKAQNMRFRPCIDIHKGKVKQIVGGSLSDEKGSADENFVSGRPAKYYALLYKDRGLGGGHVIVLDKKDSPFYEESKKEALAALKAFEGGLMAGGGINDENAEEYLNAGASHVIVTSFVFNRGRIDGERLERMKKAVGRQRLCLDLSCRKREGKYFVVTDRWQCFTNEVLCGDLLNRLAESCDEFLVHAADVEGKKAGIEEEVLKILKTSPIKVTYAGGVKDLSDLGRIRELGGGRVDATVGSALSVFGGTIDLDDIIGYNNNPDFADNFRFRPQEVMDYRGE